MSNKCSWCGEEVTPGERSSSSLNEIMHPECAFRVVAGSVGHLLKMCSCHGGVMEDPALMTRRNGARAAMEIFRLLEAQREVEQRVRQSLNEPDQSPAKREG